ncbi:MAG TPA: hypothetical protein VNQ78_07675 [Paracoccus sp. (in: a-proteobacteria)]|nr:hypothetical protein [Paracoccus sp. (in: a-proteobacteria)]HWL56542.1 hypothetical protein [Paracoccus sp. (in: a-proteobacteria)]
MNDEPNDLVIMLAAMQTVLALVNAGILTAAEVRAMIELPVAGDA